MDAISFAITYDYLCPFARNANEHVVTALKAGAPWEVRFVPFSLHQAHLDEDDTPVWKDKTRQRDIFAIEAGIAVRDMYPDKFPDIHLALFALKHDQYESLTDEAAVEKALGSCGVDSGPVLDAVRSGQLHDILAREHEETVKKHAVFGVPTFILDGTATFARIMTRPEGDAKLARRTVERVLDLMVNSPELNELKQTTIPR